MSVDPPEQLRVMRSSAGASFDFLSDPQGELMDLFDVRHIGGAPPGITAEDAAGEAQKVEDIPQSASFLVSPGGEVLWHQIATNYRLRPEPSEILEAADRLLGPA